MIVVDSSVWIDYFNGIDTPQTATLDELLGVEPLAIGDLILTEVLQGFRQDADFRTAKRLLMSLTVYDLLGTEQALKSAENFRALRKRGITIHKTADVIIATFCIERGYALLFSDRDFIPFVEHLGLRNVGGHGVE
ncbi:type II toxin-antitoxin system VapC family toxin [Methylocaldum sp.]|uniref:type II toxin-antitoxin system VapC family toxin n=1 Tax=Methylocaldum sp. TaxID=1969727 RepID=UPI002D2FEEAF|nr:PIN domain nuclease [Methylocaldum sp.]HYE37630.1 PIN domain nuclease [Methylocaldum sp.]